MNIYMTKHFSYVPILISLVCRWWIIEIQSQMEAKKLIDIYIHITYMNTIRYKLTRLIDGIILAV